MPDVNTSVSVSMLPLRRLARISSWLTGPTWWPPMAMYHCCAPCIAAPLLARAGPARTRAAPRVRRRSVVNVSDSRRRRGRRRPAPSMAAAVCCSSAAAVAGVEAERVRELGEVDALGARHGLVGADDGERQHVEVAPLRVGGRRRRRSRRAAGGPGSSSSTGVSTPASRACCRMAARSASASVPSARAADDRQAHDAGHLGRHDERRRAGGAGGTGVAVAGRARGGAPPADGRLPRRLAGCRRGPRPRPPRP